MKIKINTRFLVLPLLSLAMIFAATQCKNVGPSEWPEPDPSVVNQLKISVFNGENGSSIQGYDIKLVLPDGSTQEFNTNTGAFSFDGTSEGTYVVTASKDGYLAESTIIEVEKAEDETYSTVTQHAFYLNKRGNANLVTPQGTTLFVESDLPTQTSIYFPNGALNTEQNVTVSFINPPVNDEGNKIVGDKIVLKGYHFSPDLTFPENARPVVTIPIDLPGVLEGDADIWFGTYDEVTGTWEKVQGTLNEDRTLASFEMPHFSTWFVFTGYRLIKVGESWSPWVFVAESDTCSAGVCGTYNFSVPPTALINQLISFGYNINLKAKDTRCVGPHFKYAQQLYSRVNLVTYEVYDYTGALLGAIQLPTKKFQWYVDEYYCHDQGGGK